MKDFEFYLPKEGWENAQLIRRVEPKEMHTSFMMHHDDNLRRYGVMSTVCVAGSCFICQHIKRKKTSLVKFFIFVQDVCDAFKKLIKRGG